MDFVYIMCGMGAWCVSFSLSPCCRSLQQLLDYDGDDVEETFCLNFAVSQRKCPEGMGYQIQKNRSRAMLTECNETLWITDQERAH